MIPDFREKEVLYLINEKTEKITDSCSIIFFKTVSLCQICKDLKSHTVILQK